MNYKDINDYEILYLVSENNGEAIDILYNKYYPFIKKQIVRWLNLADSLKIDHNDLEQECYLAFTKAVNNYKESKDTLFYTYLSIVIDGHLKNFFKTVLNYKNFINYNSISLNQPISDLSNDELIDFCQDNNYFNPEEELNSLELINNIKLFLYSLNDFNASIFELHINGYKVSDISKLLNSTPGSISVSLNRIIKKFQKSMENSELLVI